MKKVEVNYTDPFVAEEVQKMVSGYREEIDKALPPGLVVPQHTDAGHFYAIYDQGEDKPSAVYESVSKKIACVKDESIQNFAMNEALRTVEGGLGDIITDGKVDLIKGAELFSKAKNAPRDAMREAGYIGTLIHDRREEYMQAWIDMGTVTERPDIQEFIREDDDPRLVAGMLGLEKFIKEHRYVPVRTEVMVYSHKYKTAGMLDDIGVMFFPNKRGKGGTWKYVLADLKTSNQFKAHYWLQIAMYYMMFMENTGLKPSESLIIKLFKDKPDYKLEYLKKMPRLVAGVKNVLKVGEMMDFIRDERKTKTIKI